MAMRGEHSEKPDEFYRLVEQVTPNMKRLDVFARKRRPGWDGWGSEYPDDERVASTGPADLFSVAEGA